MHDDLLTRLSRLADAELVAQVRSLIRGERGVTAEVIAHLAELDTRDVHLREGYTSLFVYCRDALGLSEWEPYNRIEVARAARRFPIILRLLGEGAVHLTAVRRLSPHLTAENHLEVLRSAEGKSRREVEEIVTRLAPRPDVPCSVRRVPGGPVCLPAPGSPVTDRQGPDTDVSIGGKPQTNASADAQGSESSGTSASSGIAANEDAKVMTGPCPAAGTSGDIPVAASAVRSAPAVVTPLSPDRYKLQLTISGETLEMLRLAKDMLGHAVPSGDDAVVVERALRALLTELARKRFADTPAPRSSVEEDRAADRGHGPVMRKATRTVPAAVKRVVWVRDLGRCAFVGSSGHRCSERRFVEFHHVDPYALSGDATVDGIQLRCRRHNDYEGRLYFGRRRRGDELVPEQVGSRVPRPTTRVTKEDPAGLACRIPPGKGGTG